MRLSFNLVNVHTKRVNVCYTSRTESRWFSAPRICLCVI